MKIAKADERFSTRERARRQVGWMVEGVMCVGGWRDDIVGWMGV